MYFIKILQWYEILLYLAVLIFNLKSELLNFLREFLVGVILKVNVNSKLIIKSLSVVHLALNQQF